MMKVLRQILFATAIVIGFSLSVSAQKGGDDKKRPPKDPPTIQVPDKKEPKEKPKDDDRKNDKKKPEMAFSNEPGEVEIV